MRIIREKNDLFMMRETIEAKSKKCERFKWLFSPYSTYPQNSTCWPWKRVPQLSTNSSFSTNKLPSGNRKCQSRSNIEIIENNSNQRVSLTLFLLSPIGRVRGKKAHFALCFRNLKLSARSSKKGTPSPNEDDEVGRFETPGLWSTEIDGLRIISTSIRTPGATDSGTYHLSDGTSLLLSLPYPDWRSLSQTERSSALVSDWQWLSLTNQRTKSLSPVAEPLSLKEPLSDRLTELLTEPNECLGWHRRLTDWRTDRRTTDWATERSIDWSIDWLIDRLIAKRCEPVADLAIQRDSFWFISHTSLHC